MIKNLSNKAFMTLLFIGIMLGKVNIAQAALVTDPDDPRSWQGATVETFRQAFGFSTKQDLVDAQILDDGIFVDPPGLSFGNYIGPVVGSHGFTPDPTNYNYVIGSPLGYAGAGNNRDYHWLQDTAFNGLLNANIWDLGGQANQVAVFPIIDHGPLPQETLEYTVYLSNNPNDENGWIQALIDKVYLEGWQAGNVIADGFTTVWRLPNQQTFQYTSVTALGPGALTPYFGDDDEIDAVAGLTFGGGSVGALVPEPASMVLFGLGMLATGSVLTLKKRNNRQLPAV